MASSLPSLARVASIAAAAAVAGVLAGVGRVAPTQQSGPASKAADSLIPKVKPATPNDLDFRPGALRLVTDSETGSRFWVFTYVIANKTGKTQRFSPRFELLMGDGTILEAGRDVPVDAARRVQSAAAGPRALDQFQVMGEIPDGESNAREGFVVWPAKGDAKEMTLFVGGTSAAFDRRTDPATGKEGLIRRTWSRRYSVSGSTDPRSSAEASFDPIGDAWIMR